jgi:hypothetical protein
LCDELAEKHPRKTGMFFRPLETTIKENRVPRSMSDKMAMDEIAVWMEEQDPSLGDGLPNWVWDLVTMIDEMIAETGRNG